MRFVSGYTPDFKSFLSQITFFVPQITENIGSEILKIVELILIPSTNKKTLPSCIPVAWDIAGSVLGTPRRWDCTRHPCASVDVVFIEWKRIQQFLGSSMVSDRYIYSYILWFVNLYSSLYFFSSRSWQPNAINLP